MPQVGSGVHETPARVRSKLTHYPAVWSARSVAASVPRAHDPRALSLTWPHTLDYPDALLLAAHVDSVVRCRYQVAGLTLAMVALFGKGR